MSFAEQGCCILNTHWHSGKAGATWEGIRKKLCLHRCSSSQMHRRAKSCYSLPATAAWSPVTRLQYQLCFSHGALKSVMGLDDLDEPRMWSPPTPSTHKLRGSISSQAWESSLGYAGDGSVSSSVTGHPCAQAQTSLIWSLIWGLTCYEPSWWSLGPISVVTTTRPDSDLHVWPGPRPALHRDLA